jgi:hypothetical protein
MTNCVLELKRMRTFSVELCCSQRIRCSLPIFLLSAMNQVFAAELCCLQRIRFLLRNSVVRNELGFRCRILLSAANQRSLPKVCYLQRICDLLLELSCLWWINIHCRNCVVCTESTFTAKNVLSAMNLWFAAKIKLSAANHCSLLKVCVL